MIQVAAQHYSTLQRNLLYNGSASEKARGAGRQIQGYRHRGQESVRVAAVAKI